MGLFRKFYDDAIITNFYNPYYLRVYVNQTKCFNILIIVNNCYETNDSLFNIYIFYWSGQPVHSILGASVRPEFNLYQRVHFLNIGNPLRKRKFFT